MGVKKLYFETLGNENKQNLNVWYAGIFASAYFEGLNGVVAFTVMGWNFGSFTAIGEVFSVTVNKKEGGKGGV